MLRPAASLLRSAVLSRPAVLRSSTRLSVSLPSPVLRLNSSSRFSLSRRWLSQKAAESESAASAESASASSSTAAASEGSANVPMVVRVGRGAKRGAQYFMWVSLSGLALTAGWFIVRELFPSALSNNAIFSRASGVLSKNPEICNKFGDEVKFYGEDHGGRREGRRFHIPEYEYEKDGVKYKRIRFSVEGERGLKGVAYAEVSNADSDFHYLIVQVLNTREVITVFDKREPEKPRAVRQSEVMMALQANRSVFYGNGPSHPLSRRQESELGDAFSYVKYVRCDRYPDECSQAGALDIPSWKINGKIIPGFQTLEQLETLVAKLK